MTAREPACDGELTRVKNGIYDIGWAVHCTRHDWTSDLHQQQGMAAREYQDHINERLTALRESA